MGVTMVVLSHGCCRAHQRASISREKDRSYSIREENLEAQVAKEEERAKQLEEYRVYVQTKRYIEKVAKEKLGLVNRNEDPAQAVESELDLQHIIECLGMAHGGAVFIDRSENVEVFPGFALSV